jgi:hypothetical protein
MKTILAPALACVLVIACQAPPRQYFTSCPEIDLVKKGHAAYLSGDWETFKSFYADTARIWDNTMDMTKGIGADQYIEGMKAGLADFAEYKMGENPVYEMVVTDDGQHWVHNWFEWRGVSKAGKEAVSPVNISFRVEGGKVQWQLNIYNSLPGYLAVMPSDSTQKK